MPNVIQKFHISQDSVNVSSREVIPMGISRYNHQYKVFVLKYLSNRKKIEELVLIGARTNSLINVK